MPYAPPLNTLTHVLSRPDFARWLTSTVMSSPATPSPAMPYPGSTGSLIKPGGGGGTAGALPRRSVLF